MGNNQSELDGGGTLHAEPGRLDSETLKQRRPATQRGAAKQRGEDNDDPHGLMFSQDTDGFLPKKLPTKPGRDAATCSVSTISPSEGDDDFYTFSQSTTGSYSAKSFSLGASNTLGLDQPFMPGVSRISEGDSDAPDECESPREIKMQEFELTSVSEEHAANLRANAPVFLSHPAPPGLMPPSPAGAPPGLASASVGSALHGSGTCKPCAWFWKPKSCENAKDCRHCHLCPEGELKRRRKAKATTLRADGSEEIGEKFGATKSEPISTKTKSGGRSKSHEASGKAQEEPLKFSGRSKSHEVSSLVGRIDEEDEIGQADESARAALAKDLPSAGSAEHALGTCRPCAWFHKPQGCENGLDCRHCHICPLGEMKARKAAKVAELRAVSPDRMELKATASEPVGRFRPDFRQSMQSEPVGSYRQHQGSSKRARSAERPLAPFLYTPVQPMFVMPPMPPPMFMEPPPVMGMGLPPVMGLMDPDKPLPSHGSILHGLGKCKPCAWFWKSKGCQNGKECCHCHICPEGEIKARKSRKEAAMRMGLLLPPGHMPMAGPAPWAAPPFMNMDPMMAAY